MRARLAIDDALFAEAMALAEPGTTRSELLQECLMAFIKRQSARRLAALGGKVPDVEPGSRRREEPPDS